MLNVYKAMLRLFQLAPCIVVLMSLLFFLLPPSQLVCARHLIFFGFVPDFFGFLPEMFCYDADGDARPWWGRDGLAISSGFTASLGRTPPCSRALTIHSHESSTCGRWWKHCFLSHILTQHWNTLKQTTLPSPHTHGSWLGQIGGECQSIFLSHSPSQL